jgi:hypothetical protein
MLAFQAQDSAMTLEAGLGEYYASRDGLVDGRGVSDSAREFFRCHDTAHVVFGCSTSLVDEAIVKMWSFFGTTAGFSLLRDYRSPESKEIYEQIPWSDVPGTAIASMRVAPRVFAGCRRMHERWPWSDFDRHLGTRLVELRNEYGIRVVAPR